MYIIRSASLVVLPPVVLFLAIKYRKRISTKQLIVVGLISTVVISAGFMFSPYASWLLSKTLNSRLDYFWFFLMSSNNFFWRIAGIPLSLAVLAAAFELRKKAIAGNGFLLLWSLMVSLPFAVAKSMNDRYYLLMLPALAVFGGEGIAASGGKRKYAIVALVLVATAMFAVISPAYQSFLFYEFVETGNSEQRLGLDEWLSENTEEQDKVIILSDEFMMRAIRLSAEKILPNPRNQMVVIPEKEYFEEILKEDTGLIVIFDDLTLEEFRVSETPRSESMRTWTEIGTGMAKYLEERGFEKVAEFPKEEDLLSETYFVYVRN